MIKRYDYDRGHYFFHQDIRAQPLERLEDPRIKGVNGFTS
jgi:hypothetical protein